MRRNTDGNRFLPAGHNVVNVGRAWQNHGERSRPESLRQLVRRLRHLADPAMQEARGIQMNDDRVIGWPALRGEDLAYRRRVLRICPQPIDRFGRECDELAVAQGLYGGLDLDLGSSDNSHHGPQFYQPPPGGNLYLLLLCERLRKSRHGQQRDC